MIALATLTACGSDSTGPRVEPPTEDSLITASVSSNAIDRENATVPYSFVVFASCANGGQGEVLQVSGEMRYSGHWLTSAEGRRVHSVVISSFTGSAVGWESGDVYDVETREIAQSNSNYGTDGIQDSGEDLQRIALSLTNRASGAIIAIVLVGRFVQTATGEFVLSGWDGTTRCT
jgi:hypothetical protein